MGRWWARQPLMTNSPGPLNLQTRIRRCEIFFRSESIIRACIMRVKLRLSFSRYGTVLFDKKRVTVKYVICTSKFA